MPAWPVPQNSAHSPRSGPACRPGCAARSTRPGIASILPARRGIQKEWMTSRLVTTMSTGVPAGRCRTSFGRHAAVVGIAEGPAPLLGLGLDPRRRASAAAAAAARRRPAHRRPAAAGRRPAARGRRARSSACGDTPEPQPGRRITSTNRPMTSAKSTAAPASITHHSVAIDAAAGPEGSSVDSGPAAAGQRRDRIQVGPPRARRYDAGSTRCMRTEDDDHGEARTIPRPTPQSPVLLELQRLDVGSAVALVGHPLHVMMVHFPVAFVFATLGVDVFYWWSGDAVLGARRPLVGRHGVLDRRRARASSARPSSCWCAASACSRRAGRMPSRR